MVTLVTVGTAETVVAQVILMKVVQLLTVLTELTVQYTTWGIVVIEMIIEAVATG